MESIAENQQQAGLSKTKIYTGIAMAFLFPLVTSLLINTLPVSSWTKIYASRLVFWSEILLLWLYARKVEKQNLLIWDEKSSDLNFMVTSIMALYTLNIGAQIISAIPTLLGYHENRAIMKQIAAIVRGRPLFILFISVTAGFCEEIIFRGYLLTRLSLLFKNKAVPVILSSLLFAAMHYRYNMPREYLFTFLIGIIFSIYYQRFGNIKPLIITHVLIDVINLTLASHYLK